MTDSLNIFGHTNLFSDYLNSVISQKRIYDIKRVLLIEDLMMNRSRLGLLAIAIIAIIIIGIAAWMFLSPPQACITDTEWRLVSYGSKSNPQKVLPNVETSKI